MHACHASLLISLTLALLAAGSAIGAAPAADGTAPGAAPPGSDAAPRSGAAPEGGSPLTSGSDAAPAPKATDDVLAVEINTLEGEPANLGAYRGKVVLIVNTASKCGYTPQYAKLERLHQKYKDRGLVVIGVPSNDFGGQEPGSSQEIRDFCTRNYGVTFPLMEKSQTKAGDGQSELYRVLEARTGKLPTWNFCKYVISRDGSEIAFHGQAVDPESEAFVKEIEAALEKSAPKGA